MSHSVFTNHRLFGVLAGSIAVLVVLYLLSGQNPWSKQEQSERVQITLAQFVDSSGLMSMEEVAALENTEAFVTQSGVPNFGYTPAVVWLRVAIDNPSREPLVLKINNPLIESIRVYQKSTVDTAWLSTHEVGSNLPRPIPHRHFYLELGAASSALSSVVMLRFYSRETMLVTPLEVLDRAELIKDTSDEAIKNGLYYGLVGIMLIYNLLMWLFLKERVYVFYSMFIGAFALLQLSSDGYLLLWIEHNLGSWKTWFNAFAADLSLVAMMLYTRSFLEIGRYSPAWDRLALGMTGLAGAAAIVAPFGPYAHMLNIASLLNACSVPLLVGMGLVAYRRGYTPARFFLVGYSFLLIAIGFVALAMAGLISASLWNDLNLEHVMKFGAAFEIAFFSFALAERINVMHRKSQASQDALHVAEIERRESREEAVRMAARFEQSEAIARMTQTLAHDIRKPFSMLKMGLDRLALPHSDPATQAVMVQKIRDHVGRAFDHVNGMIVDILEVSSQKSRLNLENVPFQKILSAALMQVFCRETRQMIRFEYEIEPGVVVEIDEQKVLRVLINILENARQAMRQGGKIGIAASFVRMDEQRSWVRCVIANSDSYIPPEEREKIFEAFYTSGKRGGTGLGLAICKKVIVDHGGEIECRSHKERGTEFVFLLPAAHGGELFAEGPESAPIALPGDSVEIRARFETTIASHTTVASGASWMERRQSLEALARRQGRAVQVLVIDDESAYLNQVVELAQTANLPAHIVEFTTASSVARGVVIAQSLPVDLIICDVDFGLGEKNGFEMIRDLRAMGTQAQICVHSNRCLPEDYRLAFAAGADGFLPKPMTVEHLLGLVASLDRQNVMHAS